MSGKQNWGMASRVSSRQVCGRSQSVRVSLVTSAHLGGGTGWEGVGYLGDQFIGCRVSFEANNKHSLKQLRIGEIKIIFDLRGL